MIHPLALVVPVGAGEGPFGAALAGDAELFGGKALTPGLLIKAPHQPAREAAGGSFGGVGLGSRNIRAASPLRSVAVGG